MNRKDVLRPYIGRGRIFTVLLLALVCLLSACKVNPDAVYPQNPAKWEGCPIIPSPAPWFKWGQRYIYDLYVNGVARGETYMNGYGGYYTDYNDVTTSQTYRANTWLSSYAPEYVSSSNYLRIEDYYAYFPWDTMGMSWYCKGIGTLIFDGELNIFDYPLVLGKHWTSNTTATISGNEVNVTFEGEVVAYVPAGATSEEDIIVAQGCTYTLPVPITAIPQPLAELGNKTFAELSGVSDADAVIAWNRVKVPAGPRAGQNITGYYVTQTRMLMNGNPVFEQEVWKDTRGYVPIYNIYTYPPLAPAVVHTLKLARRWTGTAELP